MQQLLNLAMLSIHRLLIVYGNFPERIVQVPMWVDAMNSLHNLFLSENNLIGFNGYAYRITQLFAQMVRKSKILMFLYTYRIEVETLLTNKSKWDGDGFCPTYEKKNWFSSC